MQSLFERERQRHLINFTVSLHSLFLRYTSLPTLESSPPFALSFSKDDVLLVCDEEGYTTLRSPTTTATMLIQAHQNAIFDCSWASDGNTFCTASADSTLRILDAESLCIIQDLQSHKSSVKSVHYDPCNPRIIVSAGRDDTIRLWDTRTDSRRSTMAFINAHQDQLKKGKRRTVLIELI